MFLSNGKHVGIRSDMLHRGHMIWIKSVLGKGGLVLSLPFCKCLVHAHNLTWDPFLMDDSAFS